jgi:hypothetical protein
MVFLSPILCVGCKQVVGVAVDPKVVFQLELERRREKEKAMTEELKQLKEEVGSDDPRVPLMEQELAQHRSREAQLAKELESLRSQLDAAQSQPVPEETNNEVYVAQVCEKVFMFCI